MKNYSSITETYLAAHGLTPERYIDYVGESRVRFVAPPPKPMVTKAFQVHANVIAGRRLALLAMNKLRDTMLQKWAKGAVQSLDKTGGKENTVTVPAPSLGIG